MYCLWRFELYVTMNTNHVKPLFWPLFYHRVSWNTSYLILLFSLWISANLFLDGSLSETYSDFLYSKIRSLTSLLSWISKVGAWSLLMTLSDKVIFDGSVHLKSRYKSNIIAKIIIWRKHEVVALCSSFLLFPNRSIKSTQHRSND